MPRASRVHSVDKLGIQLPWLLYLLLYYVDQLYELLEYITIACVRACGHDMTWFAYDNCSEMVGVKYSATFKVLTAMSIVATPVASLPVAQKADTRSLTVM